MFPSDQMSLPPFGNQPQHHYVGSDPDVQRNTTISLNENMVAKLTSSETDATVFVGDLAVLCQEEHLAALFSQYGPLKDVRIIRENKSNQPLYYGFVEFFDRAVAQQAMTQLNGYLFMGRNIRVKWATSPASPRIPTNDGRRSGGPDGDHINSQTQPQHDTSTKWSQLPKSLPNVQVLFSFISNQVCSKNIKKSHISRYVYMTFILFAVASDCHGRVHSEAFQQIWSVNGCVYQEN
jgi:RNA recognition motif-containing protein